MIKGYMTKNSFLAEVTFFTMSIFFPNFLRSITTGLTATIKSM